MGKIGYFITLWPTRGRRKYLKQHHQLKVNRVCVDENMEQPNEEEHCKYIAAISPELYFLGTWSFLPPFQ